MKKKVKINKARLITSILVVIIVIVAIVLIAKKANKQPEKITLDGSTQVIENKQITNTQEIEYDGNPYNVPQSYTTTVNEFVGEDGSAIDANELSTIKVKIEEKFKSISAEKLGINADMSNITIVFNQATTTIAEKNCLVFAVYEIKGDESNYISKFAMSEDATVLYKFDSESLIYNMIEM